MHWGGNLFFGLVWVAAIIAIPVVLLWNWYIASIEDDDN